MGDQLLLELFALPLLAIQIEKCVHYEARRVSLFALVAKIKLMRVCEILMKLLSAYLRISEVVLGDLLVQVVVCRI